MNQDSPRTISLSARRFFSGTLLSRCSGFFREVVMAAAFGTQPSVAAFWMAFRFANLLRRLFGEGGLHAVFIPHFETLKKNNPHEAALFVYQLTLRLAFILIFLVVLLEGVLGFCLFKNFSTETQEILRLTMVMLPASIFICLYALNGALLNCENSYFIPSAAPSILNLVWIGAALCVRNKIPEEAMLWLSMCIVFAFAAQWLATVPHFGGYLKKSLPEEFEKKKINNELLTILKPFLLGLMGIAATQINNALDAIFARCANPEGPAFLWYALRLQQLPLALLGVGLTGALLPPISRAIQNRDREKYVLFLQFAISRSTAWMVPLTMGIIALGFSGVNMVYGHGLFTEKSILQTTFCLWAYGLGLLPMTLVLIFAACFYAKKNYRIPVLSSLFSVALNISLNALCVFFLGWGAVSIALATTIASCGNLFVLAYFLKMSEESCVFNFWTVFLKTVCASFIAFACTVFFGAFFMRDSTLAFLTEQPLYPLPRSLFEQIGIFSSQSTLFLLLFLAMAFLLKIQEVVDLISPILFWRKGRKR